MNAKKNRFLTLSGSQIPLKAKQSPMAWEDSIKANPGIPKNPTQMLAQARYLFAQKRDGQPLRNNSLQNFDECAEGIFGDFLSGYGNPALSAGEEGRLQQEVSDGTSAAFGGLASVSSTRDGHFRIIAAPGFQVDQAAELLESVWRTYQLWIFGRDDVDRKFGRAWEIPVDVHSCSLGRIRADTAPGAPLRFNSEFWGGEPNFQKALVAHELFHRVQYIFGFRTSYEPAVPYTWFSEGLAVLMESAVGRHLTSSSKYRGAFEFPQISLLTSSYYAGASWDYLASLFDLGTNEIIPMLLVKYSESGNFLSALSQAVVEFSAKVPLAVSTINGFHRAAFLHRAMPTGSGLNGTAGERLNSRMARKTLLLPASGKMEVPGHVRELAAQLYALQLPLGRTLRARVVAEITFPVEIFAFKDRFGGANQPINPVSLGQDFLLEGGEETVNIAVLGLKGTGGAFVLHIGLEDGEDVQFRSPAPPQQSATGAWLMDHFGNVIRTGTLDNNSEVGSLVLGYQVDGHSSFDVKVNQNTALSYEIEPLSSVSGDGTEASPWKSVARIVSAFKTSVESIERRAWISTSQLTIETSIQGKCEKFVVASIATPKDASLAPGKDFDGPPGQCDANNRDCDGHCRPVVPPKGQVLIKMNWQDSLPLEPVIPATGYVLQPWPLPNYSIQAWRHTFALDQSI